MKIDELTEFTLRDRYNGELDELKNEAFWKKLMNAKYDNIIRIHAGADDVITVAEVAVMDKITVKLHNTYKKAEIYVFVKDKPTAMLKVRATYRYCQDGGCYHGMKTGADYSFTSDAWDFSNSDELLKVFKEFINVVNNNSSNFGLHSIYL